MKAWRTRPRGTPVPRGHDASEDYWNSKAEAEAIIRANCVKMLFSHTPRSTILSYLMMAGSDLSILDDMTSVPDAATEANVSAG